MDLKSFSNNSIRNGNKLATVLKLYIFFMQYDLQVNIMIINIQDITSRLKSYYVQNTIFTTENMKR